MEKIEGKVAFITGGSSGIGLGIARAFADAGMKVGIGYRSDKHLEEAMKGFGQAAVRVHAIRVDVTDRPAMAKAAEEVLEVFGKLHVLVNNAGVVQHMPLSQATFDDWDFQMSVNLDGVFNGIHSCLPHIRSHGEGGQIITTSSILGLFTGANSGIYSATKYAVLGLMEALRAELADSNIGVSAFCPGMVISNIQESSRNRPSELADTGVKADKDAQDKERALRHDPERAMDPLEAGRFVLRGMRDNDLYILTHPEYEQILRDRSDALLASIPKDVQPTEARLALARSGVEKSIYAIERARKRCEPVTSTKFTK
ncbi:SDR family oxidoreductase [Steroidobacter flavus]